MNIIKLDTNTKTITVELNYNEVRDISNGLYLATTADNSNAEYDTIYGKSRILFDLIKHGTIQCDTIDRLYNINKEADNE